MEGEVMFGEIPEFLEQEYFEEHTTGTLFLPDHTWQIRWFASVQTDAYDMQLLYPDGDMDEQARDELLDYIRQEASQYRELGVTADDRLIALSTCENGMTDGRDILIGQIIDEPDGETEGESEEGMAADSAAVDETAAEETAGRRSDAK
jgi:sortase B